MPKPTIYNAVEDMIDRNVTNGLGEKLAFADPDHAVSYAELQQQSNRLANMLNRHGLRREARIGMLMFDTVDYPVVFWGAIRAGVVPVCLNTLLTPAQYRYILEDSRVQALFVAEALVPIVTPLLEAAGFTGKIFVLGQAGEGHFDYHQEMAASGTGFDTVKTSRDEVAFWLYSSGSTGDPKGVRHIHSSPIYVAETYGREILGIRETDVCFAAAKLFFAYGLGAGMAIPMSVGATVILLPDRPTPGTILKMLKRFNPSLFFGVPTLYASMLADGACFPANASVNLRLCISAGEALPAELGKAWRQRMGVDIIDGIGSTEMLHVFLSNRPGDIRYGSSGKEIPGYRLRLVDEKGRAVGENEIGELLVSGGSAGDGYWNQRQKSRATFAGIWTHTGDKYTRDGQGYYHYCGRTDDMFKVSGRWVSPFEVEQALAAHSNILEAAVVGHEDGDGLIKPAAFVVLNGPAEAGLFDSLKAQVKASVGPWKYPRWIRIVEALPKTATGKIQRFKLREMLQDMAQDMAQP